MKLKNVLALAFILTASAIAQVSVTYPNSGTTGTTLNSLAVINATGGTAVIASTANTAVPTFIVVDGAGTTGKAVLAVAAQANCTMDANLSNTGNFYVITSVSIGGECHPQSAAPAIGTWVVGFVAASSTSSGSAAAVTVDGFFYGFGTVLPSSLGGTGVSNTATLTLGTTNRNYASLGTGIEKNTTTTGAVTLAAAADIYGLFTSCTGSSGLFLKDGGTCATAGGAPGGVTILKETATYAGSSGDYSSSTTAPTQVIFTLTAVAQTYTLLSTAPASGACVIVENSLASNPFILGIVTGGSTTLDGTAYTTAATSPALGPGQSAEFCSDGTNYFTQSGRAPFLANVANVGGIYGFFGDATPPAYGTAAVAANAVYSIRFTLSHPQLISKYSGAYTVGVAASTCDFGIAYFSGTAEALLTHTGAISTASVGGATLTGSLTTAITLPPGVYDFVWGCSSATVVLVGTGGPITNGNSFSAFTANAALNYGFKATTYSSGIPSSYTNAASSVGNSQNVPIVFFTP